jgi:asparagine synthase (glutamine-hydrolysing)
VPGFGRPGLRRLGASLATRSEFGSRTRTVGRVAEVLAETAPRRYARFMTQFTSQQKYELYSDAQREQVADVDSQELLDQAFADSHAQSDVGRTMDADVNTYLPGDLLTKVDITTMACSLEARSPLLDHHLMEWAAGLPTRLKVRSGTTKFLLKRAMAPWLPSELVTREKQGFGVPLASWLRTDLRELSRDLLTDTTARSRGLFRPETVSRLLHEHDQGRDHSTRIWALIQFELWHRTFIDDQTIQQHRTP